MDLKTISPSLHLAVILLLLLPLDFAYAQFGSIELNDTKQQVLAKLGNPLSKEIDRGIENLKYEDKLDGMDLSPSP